jgi:16S rRNA (cytidine1402-2'-O)-methyltransferase
VNAAKRARRASADGERGASGRLIVCPTPIGNLDDVTLRVLAALREADVIACEDTRHTRKLLDRHAVEPKGLLSYHEHNERKRAGELVKRIQEGKTVALVSDAGTPVVSDPGHILVRACLAAGLEVEVLPGPASPVTALVASGLPADRWCFAGFLPRRKGELQRTLERSSETLVAFESPNRLPATLALLAEIDPARSVAVCRELTKLHEEVVRGSAAEVAARFADGARGEVVIVIGPAAKTAGEHRLASALDAVERLVEAGARRRAAASVVGSLTGLPANRLYRP